MDKNEKLIKEKLLYYGTTIKEITVDASVVIPDYTNSFTVVNAGNTVGRYNNIPMAAPVPPALLGEAISIPGNRGEIFDGRIDIAFPATGAGRIFVIFKTYNPSLTKSPNVEL
jgi:hypothetical protein